MENNISILAVCKKKTSEKIAHQVVRVRNLVIDYASDSNLATEKLYNNKYDIVIIEPDIAPINGFSIVSLIRSGIFRKNSDSKIIALTNKLSNQLAENTARAFRVEKVISYSDISFIIEHIQSTLLGKGLIKAKQSVLIVEDTDDTRELYTRYLSQKFDVSSVSNGQDALDIIKNEYFDLIILDHMMPDLTGLDVLRAIRKNSISSSVIAVTASTDIAIATEFLREGAIDFLIKPVADPCVLIDACDRALKNKEILSSLSQVYHSPDSAERDMSYQGDFINGISSVIFKLNEYLRIDFLSYYWYEATEYRVGEFLGERFEDIIYNEKQREDFRIGCKSILEGSSFKYSSKIEYKTNNGDLLQAIIIVDPFYESGEIAGIIGVFINDSYIMDKALILENLAIRDYSTGLFNMHSFNVHTEHLLSNELHEDDNHVVIIHLSGFARFFRKIGYESTQKALMEFSNEISTIINSTSNSFSAYRLFGSFFAILMPYTSNDDAESMAKLTDSKIKEFITNKDYEVDLSIAIKKLSYDVLDECHQLICHETTSQ